MRSMRCECDLSASITEVWNFFRLAFCSPSLSRVFSADSLNEFATCASTMLCCCTCFCTSSNLSPPISASTSRGASTIASSSSSLSELSEPPRESLASSSLRRSCCRMTSHLALTRLFSSSQRSIRPMPSSPSLCVDLRDHVSCSMNSSITLRASRGWCSSTTSIRSCLDRTIKLTILSYGLVHSTPRQYPSATPGLMSAPGGMRHPAPGWSLS
mmetsp:Transcript_5172/g.19445  ORF Transcript_5172/g.19445 Transcript_5172/m.19445 type:complete len:214 (+) Transcript_5172:482-1123(+)